MSPDLYNIPVVLHLVNKEDAWDIMPRVYLNQKMAGLDNRILNNKKIVFE